MLCVFCGLRLRLRWLWCSDLGVWEVAVVAKVDGFSLFLIIVHGLKLMRECLFIHTWRMNAINCEMIQIATDGWNFDMILIETKLKDVNWR